jgi:two-component system OmpR family response regulator
MQQLQQQKATQQSKLLLIEDDEEIIELLSIYLQQFGFIIESFTTPSSGLEALKREGSSFQLVILDLSLPEIDGLELLKLIRKFSKIPLIISSARGSVRDKVTGLNLGADDYIPKPYEPIELIARINAILKRSSSSQNESEKDEETIGDFSIDKNQFKIYQNGEALNLTMAEFEVLKLFLKSRGKVLSRDLILDTVPSLGWDSVDRTVDVIISRIRHKIGDNPKSPKYIKSVRGAGYQFM